MSELLTFEQTVQQVLAQQRGERVCSFSFANDRYWLKQAEQLSGIWKLLKPNPKQALLNEIASLQFLQQHNAPVPQLMLFGDDFLVLKDAGISAGGCLENERYSREQTEQILLDCARALPALHQLDLIHGRPALRDMLWRDGKITFIDFETRKAQTNLPQQKARDGLIFLHSLCREESLSDAQILRVTQEFRQHCEAQVWRDMLALLARFRWVYYVLLPFKPLAKTDLIAIYRLFDNLSAVQKSA